MSNVTLKPKRYSADRIFVCAVCDLLASSPRADTLTCSTACRVKGHRNGMLAKLRQHALVHNVTPAEILESAAIDRLCPDLSQDIIEGRRKNDDHAHTEVAQAFNRLIEKIANESAKRTI